MPPAIHFILFITNLEDSKSADQDIFNKHPHTSAYFSLFPRMVPVFSIHFLHCNILKKRVTQLASCKIGVKQPVYLPCQANTNNSSGLGRSHSILVKWCGGWDLNSRESGDIHPQFPFFLFFHKTFFF
jgi:hypothetical protein